MNIRNLRVWHKMVLIVLVLTLPCATLAYVAFHSTATQTAAARNEISGTQLLQVTKDLLDHVPQHAAASASGDASLRQTAQSLESVIENDLGRLEDVDRRLGSSYGTGAKIAALRQSWQGLRAHGDDATSLGHDTLLADINGLMRVIAGKSQLAVDPDSDTRYLADAIVVQLPELIAELSRARTAAAVPAQKAQLLASAPSLRARFTSLQRTVQGAADANVAVSAKLPGDTATAINAGESFLRAVSEGSLPAREIYERGNAANAEFLRVFAPSSEMLKSLLEARESKLSQDAYVRLGIGCAVFGFALFICWSIYRVMARQLEAISKLCNDIKAGRFAARAKVVSGDELGNVAQDLNGMLDTITGLIQSRDERDAIQRSIRKLLDEVSGVADGDLTKEAEVTADMTGAIADSFNFMISELRQVIGEVQKTTQVVSTSAGQIRATAEQLATGSEEQSGQILAASSAIDQMSTSIQQVSQKALLAADVAGRARLSAKQGTETVTRTIGGMEGIRQQVQQTAKRIKRLGESSQEIGEIAELISDIADRTSILALNASIQAAMAGEAGKGFAVVAEEVERLAERSTEATKKISGLIKSIQTDTNEAISAMEETTQQVVGGSRLADEAGRRLTEIENVSNQLAEIIQVIATTAQQQATGSEVVARSVAEISIVTQETAAGAKETAGSISDLASLAGQLRDSMNRFRLPVATT